MLQLPAIRIFYQGLVDFSSAFQSLLLLSMRVFWGYRLLQVGFNKWLSISSTATYFAKLGIPLPLFNAYFVSLLEMSCGCLLIIGLASRLASLPIMAIMSVAYMTAHQKALKGLWEDPTTFITQEPFTFLIVCMIIFSFGPGRIALDYLLQRHYGGKQTCR